VSIRVNRLHLHTLGHRLGLDAHRECRMTRTFGELLKDDPVTKRWLAQLLYNIGEQQA
jgi:hypothetical protein